MTLDRRRSLTAAASALLLAACGDPTAPTAPIATEVLDAQVIYRVATAAERLPSVRATGNAGAITVRVSRPALCGTLVSARVARARGTVAVVASVAADPASLCGQSLAVGVVEYSVLVARVPPGMWTVQVFEGLADGPPRFLADTQVRVPGGA
mgnify:CR=1 FL=1